MVERPFVDHVVVPRVMSLMSQYSVKHSKEFDAVFEAKDELDRLIASIEDGELRKQLNHRLTAAEKAKLTYEREWGRALYLSGLRDGYKLGQLLREPDQ